MELNGRHLAVSASIGVSMYQADGDQISTLIRKADMAMDEVESRGRHGWMFFTESMNRAIQERLGLEIDLRQSLERADFVLHDQPQWAIGCDRTGYSCLTDPSGAAIVTAIISPARSLGITTIAEGVETEDQRLFLLQQGCDEVLGCLMGRPMPDRAIASFLARQATGGDGAVPFLSGHG